MARSNIRNKAKDVISDDGAVLISIAQGEQRHMEITLGWITDLTGYTLLAKVVEANNLPGDLTDAPMQEDATKVVTTLPIIDDDVTDNTFKIVLPKGLSDSWDVQPTPDDPVYGFFGLSIADPASGNEQQIFVQPRGMIEVRYNATESTE